MKPHLKKTWCLSTLDSRFFASMEQLLHLYALPLDPQYPVVCFDERPCYLIGETIAPLNPQPDTARQSLKQRIAKEH